MSPRLILPALGLAVIAALLLLHGRGGAPAPAPPPVASVDSADEGAARAAARLQAQAEAELRQRHDAAMRAAVSTLHRYLASLPEDRVAADAFWSGGAPPDDANEADLRELPGAPRHLRSRNRSPQVLEGAPVPTTVRIPVELRLSVHEGQMRRYAGWYELRHDPARDAWLLTGASVDASDPRQ